MPSRYLHHAQTEAEKILEQAMYVQTASRRRVQVQLLGEEQIRDHQASLEVATQATLDKARVSSIVSLRDDPGLSRLMTTEMIVTFRTVPKGVFPDVKEMLMIVRCNRGRLAFCAVLHHSYRSSAWLQICYPAGARCPGWLRSCLCCAAWT